MPRREYVSAIGTSCYLTTGPSPLVNTIEASIVGFRSWRPIVTTDRDTIGAEIVSAVSSAWGPQHPTRHRAPLAHDPGYRSLPAHDTPQLRIGRPALNPADFHCMAVEDTLASRFSPLGFRLLS